MEKTRQQTWQRKISAAQLDRTNAVVSGIDAAYDWRLGSTLSYSDDRSPTQNQTLGKQRIFSDGKVLAQKMFSYGMQLEVSMEAAQRELYFPKATEALAPPINPENMGSIAMKISQPILRNRGGKELRLEKELAQLNTAEPYYQQRIALQIEQGKTEQLFWMLAIIEAKHKNITELVALSKKFLRLMNKRQQIGRADEVDVAAAEAQLVAQEGVLLNLNIAQKAIQKQIFYRVQQGKFYQPQSLELPDLNTPPLTLPTRSFSTLYDLALRSREDMKFLKELLLLPKKKLNLEHEKDKPQLNMFASVRRNGLEDEIGKSFEDMALHQDSSVTVGISIEMSLGDTKIKSEGKAASAQMSEQQARIQQLQHEIRQEIELAWLEMRSGEQLKAQASSHIISLQHQRQVEKVKFRQARSDEVGIVRYDMEILLAKNNQMDAIEKMRLAEAKLRLLSHIYPRE
ncbi:MAG: TolC family protein [Bdellovibrionota bacterium]